MGFNRINISIEQISKSEHIQSINRFRCVVFSSFISCIYIFIWQSLAHLKYHHEIVVIGIWKQKKQIITTLRIPYGNKTIVIAQSQIRGGFVSARERAEKFRTIHKYCHSCWRSSQLHYNTRLIFPLLSVNLSQCCAIIIINSHFTWFCVSRPKWFQSVVTIKM